jgi:integrase|tara:strand:+ start:1010 stop:2290 length:1281 start_codon:yes stop_codon:yes gene_type:complete
MSKRVRVAKGNVHHSIHEILDGQAFVFRVRQSGDVYQFRMWISGEGKDYRVSLKTRDLETALIKGRKLGVKLLSDMSEGRKIFGVSWSELIDQYVEYRRIDTTIISNNIPRITIGRLSTIKTYLDRFLDVIGHQTKVSELDMSSLFDYLQRRQSIRSCAPVTVRNEQSSINHMVKWAFHKNLCHFEKFNFEPIKIRQSEVGVRGTFSLDEYDKLIRYMRTYVSVKECPNDIERKERLMIRDFILTASNTCMRVGELRQLTWGDVMGYEELFDENEKPISLVKIRVRGETSKVRNPRDIITRGGEYFKRLKRNQEFKENGHLVFSSLNGTSTIGDRKWARHWRNLMLGIGMGDYKEKKIEWYSLRHFGITCRVMSGVNVVDIAKMTGTSISHIETTYLKYSDAQKKTSALKSFSINRDGTISELNKE